MAGRIDDITKDQLQRAGQWKAFQERRDELKAQGYIPDNARKMAMAEILAECSAEDDGTSGEHRVGALPVAPAALTGRTASEPDIVRWVARNIDHPEPDAETCPDPFAWTLLRQCRNNPSFTAFYIEKLWSKLLPSRAQMDSQDPSGALDGQQVIDVIERIQAIAVECKAGTVSMPSTSGL